LKKAFLYRLKFFLPFALLFGVLLSLLRVYEGLVVYSKIGSNVDTFSLEALGWIMDWPFVISVTSIVFVIYLLISFIHVRVAYGIAASGAILFLLIAFGIVSYFTITIIPLGADLYGYTLEDIETTLTSSASFDFRLPLALIIVFTLAIAGSVKLVRSKYDEKILDKVAWIVLSLFLICWIIPSTHTPENYERDVDYYVVENKVSYFLKRSVSLFIESFQSSTIEKDTYPWLHEVRYDDPIGAYLNKSKSLPNFVFIIVEGLGRDFTGPDARYGGFTPYLDSLSNQSLYWKNFLSNAGRTFGALPSIFGSLPYGRNGFMSYGTAMPDYQTLISLLKHSGYQTNFFYGGNSNFDNQDLFLENQGIDNLIDGSKFSAAYEGMKNKSSSWGYDDKVVFDFAQSVLNERAKSPRLDIYLTLSTHEPFTVPEERFKTEFENRIRTLTLDFPTLEVFEQNANIFSCLLYTDDAIRQLVHSYQKRADFQNTIFVICGDHRLIPIPPDSKIERYHTPLIIYTPLLKKPNVFSSLATHSCIVPSVLGFLSNNYNLSFPAQMPFISNSLSTKETFSSDLDLALIRNKGETKDYIEGEYFLSEDRLFRIGSNLQLEPVIGNAKKSQLQTKLKLFREKGIHACEQNRLYTPAYTYKADLFTFSTSEQKLLDEYKVNQLTIDDTFFKARDLAFNKRSVESRVILKFLLNKSPNYHDARVLLARTHAWNDQYDSARYYLNQVISRAAGYADAYVAASDLEYWDDHLDKSMEWITEGLKYNPNNVELMAREARILALKNKKKEAKQKLEAILKINPDHELSLDLLKKLKE
jgi:lipoteichoic acid synthase